MPHNFPPKPNIELCIATRDLLIKDGWQTGKYHNPKTHCRCVLGAGWKAKYGEEVPFGVTAETMDILAWELGFPSFTFAGYGFNDKFGREAVLNHLNMIINGPPSSPTSPNPKV